LKDVPGFAVEQHDTIGPGQPGAQAIGRDDAANPSTKDQHGSPAHTRA
jgi:hypothetical protein